MNKQIIKQKHHNFQLVMAAFAGAIVALAFVNIITYNRMPQLQKDIYQMQRICKASFQGVDGKLENSCSDLIDRVQEQGFEVLNDSKGNFWAESK